MANNQDDRARDRIGQYFGVYAEKEIVELLQEALVAIKRKYKLNNRSSAIKEAIVQLAGSKELRGKWKIIKTMAPRSRFGDE